ncbi:MAG: bifunctional phosphoribosylaminoimidazolecarboxamide formyltransferase/IMP cyclohydrolase, partial [Dehalococcoidia bacterium]
MRAILSVYDKAGLAEFAHGLAELGFEIWSTGNTLAALQDEGVSARSIVDLTGFPEILDGRVKTLHPAIHGGLRARRDRPEHLEELRRHNLQPIDLVVSNLYPFVQTVAGRSVELETALEQIDIGGPTLIRASAKNFPSVLTVVDPADYATVLELLRADAVPLAERRRLAQKAFQHVATYDTAVAEYLRGSEELLPEQLTLAYERVLPLRYGENPHQQAAFYAQRSVRHAGSIGLAGAEQLHGEELSFNNILDADAAWNAVTDFDEPTAVIVKHTNPIGLCSNADLAEAYRQAHAGDPVSAYGGIVAFNRIVDEAAAAATHGVLYHIMIAPGFAEDALKRLRTRRSLRVLRMAAERPASSGPLTQSKAGATEPAENPEPEVDYRFVRGGLLVQTRDRGADRAVEFRTVTKRAPTEAELRDLRFAWRVVKHIKSNAIVLASGRALLGMGSGQPNRVTSVMLATRAAGDRARGSALASDAFFPFEDGVEAAAAGGVTAIVQ